MNYLEKFIIEQNKKSEDIIRKAFPMPFEEVKDEIIKAKRAQIGEVREWGGVKMRKEANGWVPVKDGPGKPKAEETTSKEGGETPSIEEHAKKASEAALQNAIKNSPDPEVRAAAHRELERRNKEEKSEMFSKPEGTSVEESKVEEPESKPEPKKESKKSSKFKEELHDKILMAIGNVDGNSRKLPKINADSIRKIMDNIDSDNPDYAAASYLLRAVAANGGNEVFREGYLDSVADEIDEELGKKEELTKEEKPEGKKITLSDSNKDKAGSSLSGNAKEFYNKLQDSIYDWFAASVEKGGDTDVPEGKGVDQILDLLDEIQTPMGGLGEGIGEALSYVDPYDEAGLKAALKSIERKLKKYSGSIEDIKLPSNKTDIKKSLHTTYQFLEGQSNLLQKSHINEFVFNDNFSVAKTGLELKKKFEEQLKMEIEEIKGNSRKASECLKEIGEQPTESFEDEYYWVIDGYEDKIQQLPMVFKSGGEIVDTKYSNQERTIQDKKYDYNGLAHKIVDGMIEIIHLNTLINSMIDGKTYKLNIKQAAILGF